MLAATYDCFIPSGAFSADGSEFTADVDLTESTATVVGLPTRRASWACVRIHAASATWVELVDQADGRRLGGRSPGLSGGHLIPVPRPEMLRIRTDTQSDCFLTFIALDDPCGG